MGYTGEKKRLYQKQWMHNRRQYWLNENGPCIDCGSWEALEVDHIISSSKEFEISGLWSRKKEVREFELAKCVVRCQPCHVVKTKNNNEKVHGEKFWSAILTEIEVVKIRNEHEFGHISRKELQFKYNVSKSTIRDIINRKTWRSVN